MKKGLGKFSTSFIVSDSVEAVRHLLSDKARNLTQTQFQNLRKKISVCEYGDCNSQGPFDTVHIIKDRPQLLDEAIALHFSDGKGNVYDMLNHFSSLQNYPGQIRFFCKKHHRSYDKMSSDQKQSLSDENAFKDPVEVKVKTRTANLKSDTAENPYSRKSNDSMMEVLPIELVPAGVNQFKELLLKSKQATIKTVYEDRTEEKIWNATRFTASANVLGNLRGRPEFRSGNWQNRGIKKVIVTVQN